MDANNLMQLIQTLGFPIFCCVALGAFVYMVWKKWTADSKDQMEAMAQRCQAREDKLYEQIDKFNVSLNNFNTTLTRIDTRLEQLEKKMQ